MKMMMTTVLAVGAGIAAYNMAQRTNLISNRQMRQWQKKVKRAFF